MSMLRFAMFTRGLSPSFCSSAMRRNFAAPLVSFTLPGCCQTMLSVPLQV